MTDRGGRSEGRGEGRVWYEITYTVNLRFRLTTVDRFTWTLSRRYVQLIMYSHITTVTSLRSLLRLPSLFVFFLSFAPDCWITSTGNVTLGIYFRAILLATRSLNKILARARAHVWKRLIYLRPFSAFTKWIRAVVLCLILTFSVRFNASPPSSHPWTSSEFSWMCRLMCSIDRSR